MSKYVLITGASSGIGLALARVFAKEKYNLILVGRNENKLKELEIEFKEIYKVEAKAFAVDISKIELLEKLWITIKESYPQIDIVVNNAGVGFNGEFTNIDWEKHEEVIDLNIKSLTRLNYLAASYMKEKKQGKILNVASTGSYQAGPLISVYYASKAYVLSLSEAMRQELKDYGDITVSTLCPGATKTEFSKRAGKADLDVAMSPELVAKIAYNGLMNRKAIIIPGLMNKFAVAFSRFLPYTFTSKMVKKIQSKAMKK